MYTPLFFTSYAVADRMRSSPAAEWNFSSYRSTVVRFRAASAKTNNRKMGKYHAAAGKYQLEVASA
jgi:hypothetical protein